MANQEPEPLWTAAERKQFKFPGANLEDLICDVPGTKSSKGYRPPSRTRKGSRVGCENQHAHHRKPHQGSD